MNIVVSPMRLSKQDAKKMLVRHHFSPAPDQRAVFDRLRSIQFDPLAPVGCNHDLVLQARLPDYRVGNWNKTAYDDRLIYDGWDKMASLIPIEGWPVRRIFHEIHRRGFEKKIFEDHKEAVDRILKEITDRGPLMPRECEFQLRNEEWKVSWFGPSVTKQTLRALWHSGLVMTAGRKGGQHLYDLTERVLPRHLLHHPPIDHTEAARELVLERHRAMGLLRPNSSSEIWSGQVLNGSKKKAISELVRTEEIVPVDLDGVKAHAIPQFLTLLDLPALEPNVVFVAPLDQFMWDRKMVAHVFGFDYTWEVYTPEAKRRWGYYVLPVLFGNELLGRVEFWCRKGVLDIRRWHFEAADVPAAFWPELELAFRKFMKYCSATSIRAEPGVDSKVRALAESIVLK